MNLLACKMTLLVWIFGIHFVIAESQLTQYVASRGNKDASPVLFVTHQLNVPGSQ